MDKDNRRLSKVHKRPREGEQEYQIKTERESCQKEPKDKEEDVDENAAPDLFLKELGSSEESLKRSK